MVERPKIPLFEREATGLVREIGPLGLVSITMSYAIGAGINKLSVQNGYLYPGSHVGLGFLMAGIPVVLVSVCYALLAITMPRSGGAYIFLSRLISPSWGFIVSWISWLGGWLLVGIIAYYDVAFWGMMLWNVGMAFRNPALVAAGLWCQDYFNSLWVGILLLVIALIVSSLRLGTIIRVIQAIWTIPVVGSILISIVYGMNWGLATAAPGAFAAKWNAVMGSGSYNEVMSVAMAHGFDTKTFTTFSWPASWSVASYAAIWAYGSPATPPTSVAGEVKTPTRTQLWGTVLGTALIAIYYVTVSTLMFGACDPFIRAHAFNFYEGYTGEYTITPNIMPQLPLYAGILSGNFGLAAFFGAAVALWLWNDIPPFMLYLTRFIFAWSFDRSFPSVFAKVHPTLRSPLYANLLVFVLAVIACVMCMGWWIYGIFTFMDQIACLGWIFPDMFVALAAAVLPIVRPKIYRESPISAWEVAGVPLCTIFGVVSFFGMGLFVYLVGGVLAPGGTPTPDILFFVAMMAIGLLIALIYQYRATKKGIPVSDIFREIPPA